MSTATNAQTLPKLVPILEKHCRTGVPHHAEMDAYGKAHGKTCVFAPWHPHPQYRICKTGTLLSANESYPSGVVIVDERGTATPWGNLAS